MSKRAPIRPEDNWFIGEDKTFRHFATTGEEIRMRDAATSGATSLSVHALREPLSAGDRVRWGNLVATLSAPAQVGARTLAVDALGGYLYREERGEKVQDLTGFALEWVLRESAESASALLTKTTSGNISITDAQNGVLEVAVSDQDTVALNPGSYFYTLRRTNDALEQVLAYGPAALRQPATRD